MRRLIRHWLVPRRLCLILCIVGGLWALMMLNLLLTGHSDDPNNVDELRGEILRMSEKYVRMLSRDTRDIIDGPYSGRLTGYDLKKTVAVLLENLIDRVNTLEDRLNKLSNHTSSGSRSYGVIRPADSLRTNTLQPAGDNEEPVNARDLLLGAQEECQLTTDEANNYPHCQGKINWMTSHWKSDKCYGEHGVDGTLCSFRYYLGEVEAWCPPLANRVPSFAKPSLPAPVIADWNIQLEGLMEKLRDPGKRPNYDWIRSRISRTWPMWQHAAENVASASSGNDTLSTRHRKRILVHLGLLSAKSGFKIPELVKKGGPLGELVQWSDIISSLYLLGHELTITSEVEQLSTILDKLPSASVQCQIRSQLPVDIIYTDIVGLVQFKRKIRAGYGKFSCLLRIIDSFGTEPAFNYDSYAKSHHMKTQWGMQNLQPQQFFTMFPHSPDNSFMGFVVERHVDTPTAAVSANRSTHFARKNQAVVYGKAEYMWSGKESYLSAIKDFVDIHATVFLETAESAVIPSYVTNHGILPGDELHKLLQQSKLFIGLGFPYEGPAPLEAIAQGCVFINPRFNPPRNSVNTKFFKGKPTERKLTSQHPYAEDFVGEPHVYTVDIDDRAAVQQAIQSALNAIDSGHVNAYLPYEFTQEGMLLRLSAYIQHQDFCSPKPEIWPPLSAVKVLASLPEQSCKDACWANKMICEPSHLKRLNSREILDEFVRLATSESGASRESCSSIEPKSDIYFPAFEPSTRRCFLQKESILYSCVGEMDGVSRLCSCRDFIRGQTALCSQCL